MVLHFNVKGESRKAMVKAIEKELLKHPLYSTDGQENKKVIVK